MKQQRLTYSYGVTKEQACIMCHLSADCEGCCLKCEKDGCSGQLCSQPTRDHEGQRWDTWLFLVKTYFPELKRHIPKKFHKFLKQQTT